MKAILHGTGGDPECMVLGDSDIPQPGCDELLIKVAASGVNRPDVFQRQGRYPPPPDASPILGLEVAGEVVAVGANVDEWKIGDTVTARCTVSAIDMEKKRVTFKTECWVKDTLVLEGEAVVMPPRRS